MYNVAFVYKREAGLHEGVITWTTWPTKEDFEKYWAKEKEKSNQRVLEEGISQERCIELVNQTPIACRIAESFVKLYNNSQRT